MVAGGEVGRPTHGALPQEQSKTAIRAFVAAKLAGRQDSGFYTDELGVLVNATAAGRAGHRLLWHPPGYQPPGPKPKGGQSPPSADRPEAALRDWLAVDTQALDLGIALVTCLAPSRRAQLTLYRDVRRLPGVLQAFLAASGDARHVFALVVTDGEVDRRRLRANLDGLATEWRWHELDQQTTTPAVATWRHLARLAARSEDLLRDG
jgi:hypothetical protein